MNAPRVLRCAVYTRKSTNKGLEKDFNTLEAQRESASAYITSQKSQGWIELPDQYDDGGFSGGSLERPAMQRLLEDMKAGKIDIVVVYKADRLSRQLRDWSVLMDLFDQYGTSFASVTETHSTTSSAGRLNFNMTLSFAQFEREVAGERVRDKVAMSRAKGMWMGGMLPLGYDLVDKRLVINPAEAKLVASIFKRYQACPSISALVADLDARGVMTKSWLTKKGEKRGGLPWQKKTVAYVLANPIYLGIAVHKGLHHEGQHEAIVDQALFDDVQAKASEKSATAKAAAVVRAQSVSGLLRGLLHGLEGYVFSPTFTSKGTKEYRYYVNQLAIKRSSADCEVARVPAGARDAHAVAADSQVSFVLYAL